MTGPLAAASAWTGRIAFALALVLLVWLPLPFGSNRPWAVGLFASAACGALALCGASLLHADRWPRHLGRAFPVILLLWLMWLAWAYAQTVQWPAGLVAGWSPHRADAASVAAKVLGVPAPATLAPSLDWRLSREKAFLSAAYVAWFALLAFCLSRRRRMLTLLWVVLAAGIVQAVYGSLMVLSGLEYGAWGPKEVFRGYATGTFVNRNHFAGYLELTLAACAGLIVASPAVRGETSGWRQRLRRWLGLLTDASLFARICVAIVFIALILSQSRMGNVAAVGGICIAGLAILLARRRGSRWTGVLLIVSVLAIDIWLFGRWFGLEQLAERYADAPKDADVRLVILHDVTRMLPEYATLGSGLGTFALVYPEFRDPALVGLVDHAHNDYAEFLIESGAIGTALLGALVLGTAARALLILRRRRDPAAHGVAAAGLVGMGALAVHSAADFNLQIPAVAATLLALMAAVWACPTRSVRRRRRTSGVGTVAEPR